MDLHFDFVAPGREPLMWCLIAFILTFFVTRTHHPLHPCDRRPTGPAQVVATAQHRVRQTAEAAALHIHHAVFGVILVLISGVRW